MKRVHRIAAAAALVAWWVAWMVRELVLIPMTSEQIDASPITKNLWFVIAGFFAVAVALLVEAIGGE